MGTSVVYCGWTDELLASKMYSQVLRVPTVRAAHCRNVAEALSLDTLF